MGKLLIPVFQGSLALLIAGIAVLSSVRGVSAYEIHIVQPGETLSEIAFRYGTTVDQLRRLNYLTNANFVWSGQRLRIDSGGAASPAGNRAYREFQSYTVKPGDSLTRLARRHGISLNRLAQINNLPPTQWLYKGQVLLLPASAASPSRIPQTGGAPSGAGDQGDSIRHYTVQPGDSLIGLAKQRGISLAKLMSMNGLTSGQWLYVGQVLRLPSASGPASQTSLPVPSVQPDRTQTLVHTVQPGEYLTNIAEKYGVSPAILARVNGLRNHNFIWVGQPLRIPSESALELLDALHLRLDPVRYPTYTEKWVEVDLSEQMAVAYEGTIPVRAFVISSGVESSPTVTGTFRIWAKIAMQDMRGGSRAAGTYYHLKDVRNVQYFHEGYGFHGAYWHNNFGTPMSRGCINMTEEDAEWLFKWTSPTGFTDDWLISTNANPGTLVMVHE